MANNDTGIRIIPPLVFLAAFLIAWLVFWLWPLAFPFSTGPLRIVGVLLILAPLAVMPSLFALFRRAGSKYDVRRVPKGLVTDGAFRFSRNPGYLGLVVLSLGVSALFDNPWVLPAAAIAAVVTHYQVVLKEEAVLEREFGDVYRQYKARVRRWI